LNGGFTRGRVTGRLTTWACDGITEEYRQYVPTACTRKKQVLVIMDEAIVKSVKVAAVEDDIRMSRAVEAAVRDWLN
jgi:hypothetical protein